MTFDLAELIRRHVAESPSPDPAVVARSLVDEIPSAALQEVLAELLPDAVREVIRAQRAALTVTAGSVVNGKRAVGVMAADPWRMREFVPGGGWKFRGDLTAADCDAIADEYEARAARNHERAAGYRSYASQLRARGAACLRDLDVGAVAA